MEIKLEVYEILWYVESTGNFKYYKFVYEYVPFWSVYKHEIYGQFKMVFL